MECIQYYKTGEPGQGTQLGSNIVHRHATEFSCEYVI